MSTALETYILDILDTASSEELFRAAEALVDAAITRRQLLGLPALSPAERDTLVEEIFEDPLRAASLFFGDGLVH